MQIVNSTDSTKWEKFVFSFKRSNIFSSPQMIEVFSSSDGFEVFPHFAVNDSGEIVAAAFPILVKIHNSFLRKFTNRLILYSTPSFQNSSEGFKGVLQILDELKKLTKRTALYLEIRNTEEFSIRENSNPLSDFEYVPYQNYLVDVSGNKEAIWKSLSSYTRNHIRKGEKKGLILREAEETELGEIVKLIETLYKSKNVPMLNQSVFFNAYKYLNEQKQIRIICAEFQSQIVGVRMSLNYNKTVYDWYAASKNEFSNFYVNEALAWNTIEWAIDNNYEIFDFGGGAVKGHHYGPAKFKEKFRGELVEYGRHRFISNQLFYKIASKFYKIYSGN